MTRKQPKPIKTTSRKTGAIILIVTIAFIVMAVTFYFLALMEAEKLDKEANEWRRQPCKDMIKDSIENPEHWKNLAIIDKDC